MTVERLLQIHVAILAALGTLLLGMGQRDPVLPILSIFAAATSVYFTDSVRWFVLSRTFGNIAALGAVMIASFQFWTIASDQQLLAIANLLVYLQIILLYQQKNATRYWEIAVLSLLQVVVAAALNLGFEFGVLLVIYMLTAFSALALFFVFREALQYCAADVDEPVVESTPAKKRSLRRQLLGDPVQLTALTPQTAFADGLMGWNFARNVTALGVMTIAFTIVLFFSVPRTSNAVWQGQGDGASQTGFSAEVTLNEPGQIRQSDEVVMRVTFRKPGSVEPMMVSGEPYFYGTVLTHYATDAGVSRWSNPNSGRGNRLQPPPPRAEVTYQQTVLNITNEPILFSTPAAYASDLMPEEHRSRLRFDWRSGQLRRRGDDNASRAYSYSIASTGFRGNWQYPVTQHQVPADMLADSPFVAQQVQAEKDAWLLEIDREKFPGLIAKAERIVGSLKKSERYQAATLLKDHFNTPLAYQYTLNFAKIPRDGRFDPIEDFVANHHTGHCEYFASALCLMLRSQGIPARMVVGYKGGEYNSVGGYYWVRQLHAHAWVEAFLEKDQIPQGAIDPALVTNSGGWLRLDPTPASDGNEQLAIGVSMLARVGDAMDYMQLLWDDYVLGLNSERQKKSIYTPLGDRAASMIGGIFDTQLWQEQIVLVSANLGIKDSGQLFSWRGGLAASILCAALVLLYQGAALLWRAAHAWWRRKHVASLKPERRVVEFYERLEGLLAQLGIRRGNNQTQREFARAASLRLATLGPEAGQVADLPSTVVDAFYRVRFGEAALDETQSTAIERSLTLLNDFVTRPKV